MPDPTPLVRVTDLAASYGRRAVLRDVNMEIGEGEFWFFLGPNGQGKSTLLRCILGTLRPRCGALWRDSSLAGYERIGFVPQRCDLNPTLPTTVREFVQSGLVGIRSVGRDRQERLAWALEKVGLSDKPASSYWSLSGGQRQRALVARALIRRPRLLILDEPTSGLDIAVQESLLDLLSELNKRNQLTMICVTHDLTVAVRHGSHFALFHDGTVTAGTGEYVLRADTLGRTFALPLEISRSADGDASVHVGPAPLAQTGGPRD